MNKLLRMLLLFYFAVIPCMQMAAGNRKLLIEPKNDTRFVPVSKKPCKRTFRAERVHGRGFGNGYQG